MRLYLSVFILLFVLGSCSSHRSASSGNRYNERELNLRAIITVLQHANPECNGDCKFKIFSKLNFFDNTLIDEKDNIFEQEYDSNFTKEKIFDFLIYKYEIPEFGSIDFSYDKSRIMFTPLVITTNQESMLGRVKYPNGKVYSFCLTNVTGQFIINYYREDDSH